jgi:DNA-binding transcriptional ArsR family regulator
MEDVEMGAEAMRDSDENGPWSGETRKAADALFASPTLVDLLLLFTREPEREYFVNELVRETERFPRSIQLALAKLEESGLVRSERRANARFYRAAPSHPFFDPIREIMARVHDLRADLQRALRGLPITAAFLRPAEPGEADRDLIVVGGLPGDDVENAVAPVARREGYAIHAQIIAPEEWRRQARRGRSFVKWLLEEERDYVIGDDSRLP